VSAQFEPGGQVLTASKDGTAVLWDAATGAKLATFDPQVSGVGLKAVEPSPDGQQIVTVLNDDQVWQWDRSGKLVRKLSEAKQPNRAAPVARPCMYSPDGTRVAVGDRDGTLRVWDTHTGGVAGTVKGHQDQINTVEFSSDSARILTASDDKTAAVWDAATLKPIARVHHADAVNGAAFSPDHKTFATASNDHSVRVWSATGDRLLSLDGHTSGVNAVAYSPDGSQLATVSDDENVVLWDATSGRRESNLPGQGPITEVHYDPSGTRIVTTDIAATVWSATPQRRAQRLVGHEGIVVAAQISPDGSTVATSGLDHTVRLWDRATGKQRSSLELGGTTVTCLAFSPDSSRLATGDDRGLRVWDTANAHVEMSQPGKEVNDVEWTADGQALLSASSDFSAQVWSLDGKPRVKLAGHDKLVYSAAFSPKADRIVTTSSDRTTRFWRATTGEQLSRWDGDYLQVQFDPKGELLVGRGGGAEAMIWRADDRDHVAIAQMKHDAPVMDIHWSSHGDFVVTASTDATVRVWDRNGNALVVLGDGHTLWWKAQFSRDERYIVSAGANGSVMVWEIPAPAVSLDQLLRCKRYELRGDKVVPATRPADCT
jgi:WD40 repeat protein